MTIKLAKVTVPAPVDEGLRPGDTIEIGLTSELKIDRDSTWVAYKVRSVIGADETASEAHTRVSNFVKKRFETTVYEVVDMVQAMGE